MLILGGGLSCLCQYKTRLCVYQNNPTLLMLAGLVISISGDCTSIPSSLLEASGDFTFASSCASSSISVLSVPLESTGDGSICCGYGLAGGAKESAGGPEDLYHNQHCLWLCNPYNDIPIAIAAAIVRKLLETRGRVGRIRVRTKRRR